MPRYRKRFLAAATLLTTALLTTTAACASGRAPAGAAHPAGARAADTRTADTRPAPNPPAQPVQALSASFVSPSTGWLLGEHGERSSRVLVRKTTDGGRTWFAVPAPAAPAADMSASSPPPNAVGSIVFTSERDGWAFGPALWRTTDGGTRWRRERTPGPVADLAVADGRLLAVTSHADGSGNIALRVYAAAVDAADWRPVPGTATTGFAAWSLAVSGGTGYLLADSETLARPVLLAGPIAGSARWRPLPQPCPGAWSIAVAAAPGGRLFVACGSEPGAGNQLKTAYRSRDGGHSWRQFARPPSGGYLHQATMSPGGTIFLSGERMGIYVSANRGRGWTASPSLASAEGVANAGFSLVGIAVTDNFAVAIQEGVATRQVWLTGDGGRRWTPVTVH